MRCPFEVWNLDCTVKQALDSPKQSCDSKQQGFFLNSLTQDSKMAAKMAWQVGSVKRLYVIVEYEKESSSKTESQ